jgi:hypothetical protein
MQSFLGTANVFLDFVANYAKYAAPMYDMAMKDFNWDESTWTRDYRKCFEEFKEAVISATTLYYPDNNLDWIVRSDASEIGVGTVLLQVHVDEKGGETQQPIAFASKKFSEQARRWSTYEQEAFGIYYAVSTFLFFDIACVRLLNSSGLWTSTTILRAVYPGF